jgi:chromosome segregation ATPase
LRNEVVMAMEMVLKQLEERIEEMVAAFAAAKEREEGLQTRVTELEGQVVELEGRLEEGAMAVSRAEELERQKNDLAHRLERVVTVIDRALEKTDS